MTGWDLPNIFQKEYGQIVHLKLNNKASTIIKKIEIFKKGLILANAWVSNSETSSSVQNFLILFQWEYWSGADRRLQRYLYRPSLSITQKAQAIPKRLHPKMSMIRWSHQHYLKLFKTFLKEYSISSNETEANMTSLKSRQTRVLKNQPKKWATAKKSKVEL